MWTKKISPPLDCNSLCMRTPLSSTSPNIVLVNAKIFRLYSILWPSLPPPPPSLPNQEVIKPSINQMIRCSAPSCSSPLCYTIPSPPPPSRLPVWIFSLSASLKSRSTVRYWNRGSIFIEYTVSIWNKEVRPPLRRRQQKRTVFVSF